MSAELGRNSLEKRNQIPPSSRPLVEEPPFLAEDPELLRWRADVLMDEMMVGAIDLSANGPMSVSASSTSALSKSIRDPNQAVNDVNGAPAPRRNESNWGESDRSESTKNGAYHKLIPGATENGHHHEPIIQAVNPTTPPKPTNLPNSGMTKAHPRDEPPAPASSEAERTLLSAEERYRRLATQPPNSTPTLAASDATAAPNATSSSTGVWADEQPWRRSDEGRTVRPPEPSVSNKTVRRTSAQMASMLGSVGANTRRSNLLPRMSTADVEALQREIFTLQSEIDHALPPGHESNQRARHLLEKANTILQQDNLRSAEVEYYLQQVRTIFQRVQQTMRWSSTYRNRLLVYLTAWLCLSAITMVARYLYAAPLERFMVNVSGLPAEHFVMKQFLTTATALFAGAFGGAWGALINLWQQNRQQYGFIDRKYGLRGLILPMMGAMVGLLLCLLMVTPFVLSGIDLSQQLLLGSLPALLAFLFGLAQESIYGIRG